MGEVLMARSVSLSLGAGVVCVLGIGELLCSLDPSHVRRAFAQVFCERGRHRFDQSPNECALFAHASFSTIFTPTTQSDLIPYSQDAALVLHLRMEVSGAPVIFGAEASMPRLVPGGELKLPLFEYRDPVEDVFNDLAGIDLEVAGKAEKYVNPGETVLMNLTLTNSGAVDDVFTLRVNGTNQEWAQLIGDTEVFIPTGASRPVVVAVSPPGAALDGDVADLIVTAASAAEPTITGQARVVAIVDDLLDRDDEGHLVEGLAKELSTDKQSPGPALPLLALALLALVRRAQRS